MPLLLALLLAATPASEESTQPNNVVCAPCRCPDRVGVLARWGLDFFVHANIGYGYIWTEPLKNASPLVQGAGSYVSEVGGFDWGVDAGSLWTLGRVHVGAQLGFSNYRDSNYTIAYDAGEVRSIKYTANAVDLLGHVRYDILPELGVFVLAGASYAFEQYQSVSTQAPTARTRLYRPVLSFGGGFVYFLTPQFGITLDSRFSLGHMLSFNKSAAQLGRFAGLRSTNLGLSYWF